MSIFLIRRNGQIIDEIEASDIEEAYSKAQEKNYEWHEIEEVGKWNT